MSNLFNKLYQNNTIIYKVILFLITTISVVYLFPKGGQFKYDFNNGQLWKYDNLYAPFDFAIQKTDEEIVIEKKEIDVNSKLYFLYDFDIEKSVNEVYKKRVSLLQKSDSLNLDQISRLSRVGQTVINIIYSKGFLESVSQDRVANKNEIVAVRKGNEVEDFIFKNLLTTKNVLEVIRINFEKEDTLYGKKIMFDLLSEVIKPNVFFDNDYTVKIIDNEIKNISYTKGRVEAGKLIILKGDFVEGKKFSTKLSIS